ncbi:hypothetical protein F5141DRAFT_1213812 [Pisolithus sp. B1]|nr:hypothetical protein F5141DRAFT_1213812 [Pisolithus sp. B1]
MFYLPEGNISQGEEPDHSPTVDFGNQDHGQLQALFLNVVAGDVPTPDEYQALEQAGLATSDSDDDWSGYSLVGNWMMVKSG